MLQAYDRVISSGSTLLMLTIAAGPNTRAEVHRTAYKQRIVPK